ncbi:ABC transporter substrate-binding protein [Paenibacillus sp. R14(2021)]|uniref:ABC transporter substrate-binding protein n=1 Tax=Paenibacillus sp. R14(2021) TaxID=2859228 RepID=UPI001C614BBA|nr:ABC transporter substrate-binding protein [Paenibacillus sp. R14(2021)]
MKKHVPAMAALLIGASLLSACGNDNSNAGSNQTGADAGGNADNNQEVTIQYWHTQTEEDRVKQLKALISKFESENKGVHVEQIPIAEEDFPTKISAALAANKLPAIIEGGIDAMQLLGSQEVSDTATSEAVINELGKDDFYTGALASLKNPDGEGYLGVPISGWVQGIWYNKKIFAEKGLQPPTTWENILKAAQTLNAADKKQYGIVIGKAKDDFTEQTFSQFALSNDAKIFDQNGDPAFTSDQMKEALTYYKDLSKFTPPGATTWRDAHDLYLSGSVPMMMYSTYIMPDLSKNAELAKNTGFAIPEHKNKATFGQITGLAITNTIDKSETEAAKKFVSFLMQKENNINYLHIAPGGANPTRKSVASDPTYLENPILKAFGETAALIPAGLENLQRFGFQDNKTYTVMGDISSRFIIPEAVNSITEHDGDVNEAADKAEASMKETVAQSK